MLGATMISSLEQRSTREVAMTRVETFTRVVLAVVPRRAFLLSIEDCIVVGVVVVVEENVKNCE